MHGYQQAQWKDAQATGPPDFSPTPTLTALLNRGTSQPLSSASCLARNGGCSRQRRPMYWMHAIRPQHISEKPAPALRVTNTEIQNILAYLPHAQLMPDTVKIRKRGVMTLPKALREKYQLEEGDVLHLVDVDGVFVLTTMAPVAPQLAREIERMRTEAELTTEDLLSHLQKTREELTTERYGNAPEDASGA